MELIDSIGLLLTNSEMTDRCVVLIKDGKARKRPDSKRVTDFLAYRVVEGAGGVGDRTAGTKRTQLGRVAKRFALVQVALELAHQYGLLPFPVAQIDWAISTIFSDWIDSRGGDGSIEIKRAINSISLVLTKSEMTDRCVVLKKHGRAWKRSDSKRVSDFLAYRVVEGDGGIGDRTLEFWIPQNIFDDEFCDGVDRLELVKELQRMGWLELNSESRPQWKVINENRERFYIFRIWKKVLDHLDHLDHSYSNAD